MLDLSEICIDASLIQAFRVASLDENPLHIDHEYARNTHFGGQVAYGVLVGLAALARLGAKSNYTIDEVWMEFRSAVFPDDHFVIETRNSNGQFVVSVMDGPNTVLRAAARLRVGSNPQAIASGLGESGRTLPRKGRFPAVGSLVRGKYNPPWPELQVLSTLLGLDNSSFSQVHLAALAFCSYLAGMELPGERALLRRVLLTFQPTGDTVCTGFNYDAKVLAWDDCLALATVGLSLSTNSGVNLAVGQLQVFERFLPPPIYTTGLATRELSDRVALVVGGSRGLGAAFVHGLHRHGATVIGVSRGNSKGEVEVAAKSAAGGGLIRSIQADGADRANCVAIVKEILTEFGKLDLLICNASPPLHRRRISLTETGRFKDYVDAALAVVEGPLSAALPALSIFCGTVVIVSSSAVVNSPREWPHYVAAKKAVEKLAWSLARINPTVRFIILRPPRLLTGFTLNASLGNSLEPHRVVQRLITLLLGASSTHWSVVDRFGFSETNKYP